MRLILPGLVVAAGVAVGNLPGFLLAFAGGLVALDRVLGSPGAGLGEAERAWRRMTRGRRGEALAYLDDERGWAAIAPRRRLGVQAIAVASIVGSTDRHKAALFDRAFRPPDFARGRWTLLRHAAQHGAALPPISVYRVGDEHFVRDGHHRVSVARSLDAVAIEAHVVELARGGGE
jgi:hypothetical protein